MKFYLIFPLMVVCITLLQALHPVIACDEKEGPCPSELLACLKEEQISMFKSCEIETDTKLKDNSTALEIIEGKKDGPFTTVEEKLIKLWFKLYCECLALKNHLMDDATSQLDMTKVEKTFVAESSLTTDQKAAASAAIKSCILGKLKSPTLPIFIERAAPGAVKPNKANGNIMTSIRLSMCIVLGLLKNSCPDPNKIDGAAVTRIVKEYEDFKEDYEITSSEESD